jgi:hypothetical protein
MRQVGKAAIFRNDKGQVPSIFGKTFLTRRDLTTSSNDSSNKQSFKKPTSVNNDSNDPVFPNNNQTTQVKIMRERMRNENDTAKAWDSLWQDKVTPWDLGRSTPALISQVASRSQPHSFATTTLIPGCGSGYDLVALARYLDTIDAQGDARIIIGLEISKASLERAQQVVDQSYRDQGPARTRIELYEGDFFASPLSWNGVSAAADSSAPPTFDLVFDYLFFCAIPPSLRPKWGEQMSKLLAKTTSNQNGGGQLLTLMFPYSTKQRTKGKQAVLEGPPYPVCVEDYRSVLEPHDMVMETSEPFSSPGTFPARQGQEKVAWWRVKSKSKSTLESCRDE